MSDILSDNKQYPNFARSVGTTQLVAKVANHVTKLFGWDRIGIISDKSAVYLGKARDHEKLHSESGKEAFLFTTSSTSTSINQAKDLMRMRQILRLLKTKCRVIFVYMYAPDTRNVLVIAQEEGMQEGKLSTIASKL